MNTNGRVSSPSKICRYTFNPPEGYIVTANNRCQPWDYPYLITRDWDYGFRAQRIVDMIESASGKIDIAYFQSMQGDSFDANGPSTCLCFCRLGCTLSEQLKHALNALA